MCRRQELDFWLLWKVPNGVMLHCCFILEPFPVTHQNLNPTKQSCERRWCHNSSSFCELERLVLTWDRMEHVSLTFERVYPNALSQNLFFLWILVVRGKIGRLLLGQNVAHSLIPLLRVISIFVVVWRAWPPIVLRRTCGLRRRTSAFWNMITQKFYHYRFSVVILIDHCIISSPATWFEEDRSFIFILLSL